jgi:isoleucyl-tRNA synthetase
MSEPEKSAASEIALREEAILAFWNENTIFEKSVEGAPSRLDYQGDFIFNDGPPFATGTPHYGHLMQSAIKDAIPRYKTMRGFRVARQWGWDCHGLPIENIVEKELGTSGKKDIEALGVKKFNELCREKIFTYVDIWNNFIPRFGRWADMKNPYKTMDKDFMESEWWAFKTLYDKGLIYEDYRTMHVCPRCETTLAQSEVAEGYKIIKDLAVTVEFPIRSSPNTVFLAWTTTPWTLPGNVALAVGASINYVYVTSPDSSKTYIVAESRFDHLFKDAAYAVVKKVRGSELLGIEYIPPFNSYRDSEFKNKHNAWKVYAADFITDTSGTGIAHEAPAFGAEDMALAQEVGLPLLHHVGMNGVIVPEVTELAGLLVKPAGDVQATDVAVIKYLAGAGILFSKEKYEHSYPHCWRCDTPLINYATTSWFVAVQKMKEQLLSNAAGISWAPAHIKNGRWGEWLTGARDWSISRQRFWANTMPVWKCASCSSVRVFGSCSELEAASSTAIHDLHKDVVDDVVVPCACGGAMHRIPDVLDTWFNSGSVPFATRHYVGGDTTPNFAADFIGEALDQVSKWFYYQHVLATGLFNMVAFRQVVTTGIVLAEDGKKMSKRLMNYPDPIKIVNTYGADSVRLYILVSPVVRGESLNFSEVGVAELSRKVIGRLVNVYEFYAQYQTTVQHVAHAESTHILDRWICARFSLAHREIAAGYEAYDLNRATRPLIDFVDDLSVWYLRRSRDRIKEGGADAAAALATMCYIFREFSKIAAPSVPFIADWLWQQVRGVSDVESVHLAQWTTLDRDSATQDADEQLHARMTHARQYVTLGLEQRTKSSIKVRQPLAKAKLFGTYVTEIPIEEREQLLAIIRDELNVKTVECESLGEDTSIRVEIDSAITPELQREGEYRDLLRSVQELRKQTGLHPNDVARLSLPHVYRGIVEPFLQDLQKVANLGEIIFSEDEAMSLVAI